MTEIVLRPARPDERAALEALQRRASIASGRYRQALSDNPDAIDLPDAQIQNGSVTVAERGGAVVGFAVVLQRQDVEVELDGLFVEPEAFRNGVGSALLRAAERAAWSRGAAWLHVIAGPDGLAFYAAHGFEFVGEASTRFGPASALRKRLPA